MDRSSKVVLIDTVYETDDLGQRKVKTTVDGQGHVVPVETRTEVFCSISSVNYKEWYQAKQSGITPEYVLRMLRAEYGGQKIAEFDGDRYFIYRTYVLKGEMIDLTLEKRAGI